MTKKEKIIASSMPSEVGKKVDPEEREPIAPQEPMETQAPQAPEPMPLTEDKLIAILASHDELVKQREDDKLRKMLDTLVQMSTEAKEKQSQQQTANQGSAGAQSQGFLGGSLDDILKIVNQFGLGESEGSPLEMEFAKMIKDGYSLYLRGQMKSYARAVGVPWHEVEGLGH